MKIPSKSWIVINGDLVFKTLRRFRDTEADDDLYYAEMDRELYELVEDPNMGESPHESETAEHAFDRQFYRPVLRKKARLHTDGNRKSDRRSPHYWFTSIPRRLVRRKSYENSTKRCLAAKTKFTKNLRRIVLEDIEYDYSWRSSNHVPVEPAIEKETADLENLEARYWEECVISADRVLELEKRYESYILYGLRRFANEHGRLPEGCTTCAWATDDLYLDVQMIARSLQRSPAIRDDADLGFRSFNSFDAYDESDFWDGYADEAPCEPPVGARQEHLFRDIGEVDYEPTLEEIEQEHKEEKRILLDFEARHDHLERKFDRGAKRVRAEQARI